ncbi:MAG: hypothetical protein MJ059_08575 [Lachnospiraceae bacterium]|nr:hypothetical protein [Lachnospiraceae bacterium]
MADLNNKFDEFTNTADHTAECDAADIQGNKIMGVFAYLGLLLLIPLFGAKNSKFARFHVNQGLVLWVAVIVVNIVLTILGKIPVVKIVASIASYIVSFLELVLCVMGIVNACNGKAKELPLIGSFQLIK